MLQFDIRRILLVIGICLISWQAGADERSAKMRGQLLYETHCLACHASQVHWREKRLVTDWASLKAEVGRWQYISNLNWSDREIEEVARYLDELYYGYNNVAGKIQDQ